MITTTTFKKGYGYWDTTNYPYGGCFRRAAEDFAVEITNETYKSDLKFYFVDKDGKIHTAFSSAQSFGNWKSCLED